MTKITKGCLGPNCPNNCCGSNFIGPTESFIMENNDILNAGKLSKEDIKRLKKHNKEQYITKKDGKYFLALYENGSCKAFVDGICLINDIKPDICRLYPYYFDFMYGVCIDKHCHGNFSLKDGKTKEMYDLYAKRLQMFRERDLQDKNNKN